MRRLLSKTLLCFGISVELQNTGTEQHLWFTKQAFMGINQIANSHNRLHWTETMDCYFCKLKKKITERKMNSVSCSSRFGWWCQLKEQGWLQLQSGIWVPAWLLPEPASAGLTLPGPSPFLRWLQRSQRQQSHPGPHSWAEPDPAGEGRCL